MVDYIDEHVDRYGVEPICAVLPLAPSTYYAYKACKSDVTLLSARACRDAELEIESAYSGQAGHPFRLKPATDSGRCRAGVTR